MIVGMKAVVVDVCIDRRVVLLNHVLETQRAKHNCHVDDDEGEQASSRGRHQLLSFYVKSRQLSWENVDLF